MSNFRLAAARYRQQTEQALDQRLPAESTPPTRLHSAMRYVCLGGKRLRATLVYASGELVGAPLAQLDAAAAALEMLHAYSLTHDDLPAMDDDAWRRGRATCHIQYDTATAILVGDALQSRAFEVLATDPTLRVSAARRLRMLGVLAAASGSNGMAGGQQLDMQATATTLDAAQLQQIHRRKTAALIRAAVQLGALSYESPGESAAESPAPTNESPPPHHPQLDQFAQHLGLAFQIVDDILDATASSATLGKPAQRDAKHHKATYVTLFGLAEAQRQADQTCQQAVESVQGLGDNAAFLRQLVDFVRNRTH